MTACGKRHDVTDVTRCELPKGHDRKARTGLSRFTPKHRADLDKWAKVKKALLEEHVDDYPRCANCGVVGNRTTLDADHIIPRSRGGESELSNARLLCNPLHESGHNCHGKRHGIPVFRENFS